ncbi:MAG TPA: hypothetical protein VHD60_01540 [Candidatus Saccharimonadales bacterium]|nr:hypothetical protein [Candidatus Saccharimonadales bacterium]
MQPQQPYYGPPQMPASAPSPTPQGQDPYGFIMDPGKPPRRGLGSLLGGGAPKQRLVLLGGTIAVVLILIIIVASALSGGGGNSAPYIKVAQDQTEIARVAGLATHQQTGIAQATQNFALTTQLSLTSDRQQLVSYLQKHGVKVSDKTLTALQNSQTDQQLSAALDTNSYDSTFLGLMKTDLGKYQTTLKTAYAASNSATTRQLLNDEYANTTLLLKQLATAQD